ncbi:MAG: urease accessory protein UreD [Lautropia sp.]|nr:urease accessory protein UreD [Lautropia sp.]
MQMEHKVEATAAHHKVMGLAGGSAQPDQVGPAEGAEGWRARLQLSFAHRGGRTVLAEKRHEGPMLVQRPFYPEGGVCHIYVLHPPGGVVGGDHLFVSAELGSDAHALITMPGATKFYRSQGARALVRQRLKVAPGATLEWLPQDNIFFPGVQVRLDTCFELDEGARLIAWEVQCLGRPAMDEAFSSGQLRACFSLMRTGRPLLHENLQIADGNLFKLGGHPLAATLVATPADEGVLHEVRECLKDSELLVGATLIDDLLVLRLLAHDNWALSMTMQQVWQHIRPLVLCRSPSTPRIWLT